MGDKSRYFVRYATLDDTDIIYHMYDKALQELGEKGIKEVMINKIMTSLMIAPCFLLVKDDIICGMAGLTLVRKAHNDAAMLSDYMVYVEPQHRSINTLGELINNIKEFANMYNLPVRLDFIVKCDIKSRSRLLKIFGFNVKSLAGVYE